MSPAPQSALLLHMPNRNPRSPSPLTTPTEVGGAIAGLPDLPWALAFTFLGLLVSVWMALHSDGTYHDDDLTHMQIARAAWTYPAYLLDEWGRPGFTVLYAPAARLGWLATRVCSGLLTALTAWLAYLIAVRLRVRLAAVVPALLWLAPLTFTLSYTTLTETPLALYFTLAGWLFLRGNHASSAAVISLAAVTRHEAGLFVLLWLVALLRRRRPWREWIWVAWAPVLYHVLSSVLLDQWPLLRFFDAHPTNEYGAGTLLTMLTRWPVAAGIGPLLLAWIGLPALLRRSGGALWAGAGLAYFGLHTVIYCFGLFASGGYERFLVPISPVVAVAAAEALSEAWLAWRGTTPAGLSAGGPQPFALRALVGVVLLWTAAETELGRCWANVILYHAEWTRVVLRSGALALVVLCAGALLLESTRRRSAHRAAVTVVAFTCGALALVQPFVAAHLPPPVQHCAPLVLTDRELAYRDALGWLHTHGRADRRVVAASPWVDEFMDRVRPPGVPPTGADVLGLEPGGIVLWDAREFASPRHGLTLEDLRHRSDFVELWHSGGGVEADVYCAVFERQGAAATQARSNGARD